MGVTWLVPSLKNVIKKLDSVSVEKVGTFYFLEGSVFSDLLSVEC